VPVAPALVNLIVALGLGLLVGLQRESTETSAAGLRTFGLITVSGCLAGLLVPFGGGWVIAAAFTGVALLVAVSYYRTSVTDEGPGLTTEVALLTMFLVGAYLATGERSVAVVVGGGVAVLLQAKQRFRRIMERLGSEDVRAIIQFALLALVILPALPNIDFGPYDVLNAYEMWLLVVLIVGINLGGYIGWKFLGRDAGTLVAGVLGGVISSTATTVSYARRSKATEGSAKVAAVVVMIASAIVLIRVLIEIGVVAPSLLRIAAIPISILLVVSVLLSVGIGWHLRKSDADMPEQENPTHLRPALFFAALYAVVLLAVAYVRDRFGEAGLYPVAALAGLTDVDAITLSTGRMVSAGQLSGDVAWRVIVVAYISNLVFKAGIVAVLGSRALLWRTVVLFGILSAAGGLLIALYP
jgi:uncharacterized membrane protein (DUF4010 family)